MNAEALRVEAEAIQKLPLPLPLVCYCAHYTNITQRNWCFLIRLLTPFHTSKLLKNSAKLKAQLDGSLPANPVIDRRIANAVTLESAFCLPQKSAIIQKYLIMEPPEK